MAIATGARAVSKNNGVRIDALEKRMQLLAWKQDDLKLLVEAPRDNAALSGDRSSNDQTKQAMGQGQGQDQGNSRSADQVAENEDGSSDNIDSVQGAVAHAIKRVNTARNQVAATSVVSQAAVAAGVVPQGGSDIIGTTVENLGSLNPVAVAAVTAKLSQTAGTSAVSGSNVTGTIAKAAGAAALGAVAVGAAKKLAKKTAVASYQRSLPKTRPVAPAPVKMAALKTPVKPLPTGKAKPRIARIPLPVRKTYALKLHSGRSVESLRLTWDLLSEMNRPMLGKLKTRYIKTAGHVLSPYRLIAGPLRTSSSAKQICAKLHKQNINCDVTIFTGRRL